ncbi:AEC family transporter [Rhodobacteraceae bacterium RKSG542]|uniref:AEC family transporter n=1 Tax=Pseudovibrio flavus TaxID=2529854 RepID=UPI0012BCBE52|nr:AEC family transporter [Pseudovibrio flavus]MTI16368.1 AEC family transporter [Pseudovibrio flavus]
MPIAVTAMLPIILLIATGWTLNRKKVISAEGWNAMDKLGYYLLFPATLFNNVSTADFNALDVGTYAATLYSTLGTLCVLLILLQPLLKKSLSVTGPAFSSIFQGSVRWNAFIVMGIAGTVWGKSGLAITAITMALLIPVINVITITMMTVYASGKAISVKAILLGICKNPFIIAISAGLVLNLGGVEVPQTISTYVNFLGRAAVPLALLCIGASMDLDALRKPGPRLIFGSVMRLAIAPAVALLFAHLYGLDDLAKGLVVLVFAVPTAASAFVLAKQMGGDSKLMAELLALQAVLAAFTLTLWLLVIG